MSKRRKDTKQSNPISYRLRYRRSKRMNFVGQTTWEGSSVCLLYVGKNNMNKLNGRMLWTQWMLLNSVYANHVVMASNTPISRSNEREKESAELLIYVRSCWTVSNHWSLNRQRTHCDECMICDHLQQCRAYASSANVSAHVNHAFVRCICIVDAGSRFCVYQCARTRYVKFYDRKCSPFKIYDSCGSCFWSIHLYRGYWFSFLCIPCSPKSLCKVSWSKVSSL